MSQVEQILLNFSEIRRRSIMLWRALPESHYHWKVDDEAMSAIEMIRHVLEADYGWNMIIKQESLKNYTTPWKGKPMVSVEDEIKFAEPYRKAFIESIRSLSDKALNETEIIHPGNGKKKNLGQYLLRIGYHEGVHAGQFTSYLRAMNIERPNIWD
tara:strand:- start:4165 stop:4632 length:468 start_codon:yes stop_codon:yes gene_type:complete